MDRLGRIKIACQFVISSGMAKNMSDVGERLGYTNKSSFSQLINGLVNVPRGFSSRFCEAFPSVRYEWLEKGEGSMDGKSEEKSVSAIGETNAQTIERLCMVIEQQAEIIRKDRENTERLIGIIERLQGN